MHGYIIIYSIYFSISLLFTFFLHQVLASRKTFLENELNRLDTDWNHLMFQFSVLNNARCGRKWCNSIQVYNYTANKSYNSLRCVYTNLKNECVSEQKTTCYLRKDLSAKCVFLRKCSFGYSHISA